MKTTLTSGNTYTIQEFFANDYKMVIPDMQREYCWATVKPPNQNKSLITLFISDLIKNARSSSETIQMGLLYAYESPKNDIQLCDGQQRITSLYLLMGCLYKVIDKTSLKAQLKNSLIVEAEFSKPRLQYAIRETTLYFLKDLVNEYFLKEGTPSTNILEYIKNQDWYFQEYQLDPTVQNMLLALESIESLLKDNDINKLAEFVLKKIAFMYFDMENRTYGEEQFVVLNTTGKPLTITENIKPKILGDLDDSKKEDKFNSKTALRHYADMWENWEQFFWKNKHESHSTADNGLSEFFRWIYIIEQTKTDSTFSALKEKYSKSQKALTYADYSILELEEDKTKLMDLINQYFIDLKQIEKDKTLKKYYLFNDKKLNQIDVFIFLPLLVFIRKIKNYNHRDFLRLKNFLLNRAKNDNVAKASVISSVEAIKTVKLLLQENKTDIANFAIKGQLSKTIFDNLEIFKFKAYLNTSEREKLENLIWEAESLNTTNGNIQFMLELIKTDLENINPTINFSDFNKITEVVKNTFEKHSDLLRKCLLTYGDYTIWDGTTPSLGATRYSLGNSASFYGDILNDNHYKEERAYLLDFLTDALNENNIDFWMSEKVENFIQLDKNTIWDKMRNKFIINKKLMSDMQKKLYCVSYDEKSLYLLHSIKATSYKKI